MVTNVDPLEIQKFSELAARWWDPKSEFRPLHEINPLRLGYIQERSSLEGQRVLDVGCGGGILAESMAVAGADVTGIEQGGKKGYDQDTTSNILIGQGIVSKSCNPLTGLYANPKIKK